MGRVERSGPVGKEWARGKGVGRGERGGPGRSSWPGGKEWAGGKGVGRGGLACCTLYMPTSKIFYSIF